MYDSTNAPPEIAAIKTMLEASSTWVALSTGTIHYPSISTGDSASPSTLPFALLEPVKDDGKTLAPGVILPGGTVQILLTMKDSTGASIEKTARAIGSEIMAMHVGLPVLEFETAMCNEPQAGDRAAQEYSDENTLGHNNAVRTIALIFTYGLT